MVASSGTVLIVNAVTGCIRSIDLSEEVDAQVLAVHAPSSEFIVRARRGTEG